MKPFYAIKNSIASKRTPSKAQRRDRFFLFALLGLWLVVYLAAKFGLLPN